MKCLLLINDLFLYERQHDAENLPAAERLERRNMDCALVLEQYRETVEAQAMENTTGNLQKAVTYALNQKEHLMKFMEHGDQ